MVDHTALRFNQSLIIGLLAVSFLADLPALTAVVSGVMLIGTLWPRAALFKAIYARVLRPLGWLRPDLVADDPRPHLFAQGLGGIFLLVALLLLNVGPTWVGWLLVGMVVLLAAVNLLLRFCVGCFIYYQLARRGLRPGLPWWQPVGHS